MGEKSTLTSTSPGCGTGRGSVSTCSDRPACQRQKEATSEQTTRTHAYIPPSYSVSTRARIVGAASSPAAAAAAAIWPVDVFVRLQVSQIFLLHVSPLVVVVVVAATGHGTRGPAGEGELPQPHAGGSSLHVAGTVQTANPNCAEHLCISSFRPAGSSTCVRSAHHACRSS